MLVELKIENVRNSGTGETNQFISISSHPLDESKEGFTISSYAQLDLPGWAQSNSYKAPPRDERRSTSVFFSSFFYGNTEPNYKKEAHKFGATLGDSGTTKQEPVDPEEQSLLSYYFTETLLGIVICFTQVSTLYL